MEIEHYSIAVPGKPMYEETAAVKIWQHRLAYWISILGSPPVLAILMTINLAAICTPRAWAWAGNYIWLAIVTPLLYVAWQVQRGRITDIDVQLREQRSGPILVTLGCASLAWLMLALGNAPLLMSAMAGAVCLQSILIFIITLRWKISVHAATASGAATLAWIVSGSLWPLLIGVPLIAWSRVHLRRHTPAQVAAGALLGCLVFLAPFGSI